MNAVYPQLFISVRFKIFSVVALQIFSESTKQKKKSQQAFWLLKSSSNVFSLTDFVSNATRSYT